MISLLYTPIAIRMQTAYPPSNWNCQSSAVTRCCFPAFSAISPVWPVNLLSGKGFCGNVGPYGDPHRSCQIPAPGKRPRFDFPKSPGEIQIRQPFTSMKSKGFYMGKPSAETDLFQVNASVESLVAYTRCPIRNRDAAQSVNIEKSIFSDLLDRFRNPAVPAPGNQCI